MEAEESKRVKEEEGKKSLKNHFDALDSQLVGIQASPNAVEDDMVEMSPEKNQTFIQSRFSIEQADPLTGTGHRETHDSYIPEERVSVHSFNLGPDNSDSPPLMEDQIRNSRINNEELSNFIDICRASENVEQRQEDSAQWPQLNPQPCERQSFMPGDGNYGYDEEVPPPEEDM